MALIPYLMIILGISVIVYPVIQYLLRTMIIPGAISISLVFLLISYLCQQSEWISTIVWFIPNVCYQVVSGIRIVFPVLTEGVMCGDSIETLLSCLFYCIGMTEILSIAVSVVEIARVHNASA